MAEQPASTSTVAGNVAVHVVESERTEFTNLLAANPNYFGGLPNSKLKPVKIIQANTVYEELACVGYNQNLNTLEATILIKLPSGYLTELCGPGSTEYVRFWVDYGAGFLDQGVVGVNVHDILNANDCAAHSNKPLVYVVTLPIDPKKNVCFRPVLPNVRAILSWQSIPSTDPNQPLPAWGNRMDRHIQIQPRPWFLSDVALAIGDKVNQKISLPEGLEKAQSQPIPIPYPDPQPWETLAKTYAAPAAAGTAPTTAGAAPAVANVVTYTVPPHRFGLSELHPALHAAAASPALIAEKSAAFEKAGINWETSIGALLKTSGDTTYEELECLGLDYNREWLIATVNVKKPGGYSGSPCSAGSQEYVAFWADWDDRCEWTYLGTRTIPVHDYAAMPADGLHYAVVLPVNLDAVRNECHQPKIARVRAVLSWSTPPSTTLPDDLPHWGNRVDSHVQIKPGDTTVGPRISIIGAIGIANIDTAVTGTTIPNAKFAWWDLYADSNVPARQCPFAGVINIQAPDPGGNLRYHIQVQHVGGGSFSTLSDPVWVTDQFGNGSYLDPDPGTNWFRYLDHTANVFQQLAAWAPGGTDQWEIRLEWADAAHVPQGATPWYRVQVDNSAPDVHINITGGACDKYTPGTVINGTFVAKATYFGSWAMDTLPGSLAPPAPRTPAWIGGVSSGTNPTSFGGDPWQLDTSSMSPCGYVVRLQAWTRAIYGSEPFSKIGNPDDKGFCLLAKTP